MRSVLKAFNYLLYRIVDMKHLRINIGEKIAKFIEFLENIIPHELRALLFHSVEWIFFMKETSTVSIYFYSSLYFSRARMGLLEILFTEQQCRDSRDGN